MPLTSWPGLLAAFGAPYVQLNPLLTPGEVYFVNSVRGSNNNDGRDVLRPRATWQNAYNSCRANRGDMVVLLPGHLETYTAAAAMALNIAGVTTLILGHGANRPTITLSTAVGASIDVTAANNIVAGVGGPDSGLIISAVGVDAITAALNVQAASFAFINNRMVLADATNQAVLGILTTNAADRMRLYGNRFEGTVDAGCTTAVRVVGGDRVEIVNNYINGAFTAGIGCIENVTTDTTDILIDGNVLKNRTATSTKAFVLTATATGHFTRNRMSILSGTAPITAAAGTSGGDNTYSNAVGVAATQTAI